jgi:glycosyltransferase involved in cell wall biosynthesis
MISMLPEKPGFEVVSSTPILVNNGRPQRRVCMVAYAFYESDTRIMQYATALVQRGDVVDVIALRRDESLPLFQVVQGVNVYRIQTRVVNEKGLFSYSSRILKFLFKAGLFLWRRGDQNNYDLVHVHNVPDLLVFAAVVPKLKKIPVILDIHDLLPEFYASKFKVKNTSLVFKLMTWVEKRSAAFSDHVIVANHIWRDRYATRSSQAEKCSVVRNRPDLEIFTRRAGRDRVSDGRFLMVYPGSLNGHQGLDIAIRAFARIEKQMPDAEFHIYGEGPAKPGLMALAQELNQQRVFFHDFLPSVEIAQVMAKADLAIEPKRTNSAFSNEALSTKILEFMSLGVPVIACRTRIHYYYYDDSIIQYYENDDDAQLAQQIVRLRQDPYRRAALVENAKRYVKANTWNACKHEYLELVDACIGQRKFQVTNA